MGGTRRGSGGERKEVDGEVKDVDEGGEEEHGVVVVGVGEVGYEGGADGGGEES